MLTIIRGLPGSGKSTLARKLADNTDRTMHVEADQFFEQGGHYKFDASQLGIAHADCLMRTRTALEAGIHVYVANTFTQRGEYRPYLALAEGLGVAVQVIDVHGEFGSIHNVPDAVITRMRNRWEPHRG